MGVTYRHNIIKDRHKKYYKYNTYIEGYYREYRYKSRLTIIKGWDKGSIYTLSHTTGSTHAF